MRLYVRKPIRLKIAGRLFDIQLGGIVEIKDPRKAQGLIESGHVRPLLPPDEAGKPIAAKIYSHILQNTVLAGAIPTFTGDGDGIPVYTIEEIRMMRGASPDEIRTIHNIKKELGGN